MSRYDETDPLTVLSVDDVPVHPDPVFAAQLRRRLEAEAERAGATTGGSAVRRGSSAPVTSAARTITLRTAAAVALVAVMLLSGGWLWSLDRHGVSDSSQLNASHSAETASKGLEVHREKTEYHAADDLNRAGKLGLPPEPNAPPTGTTERDVVTTGSLQMVVAEPTDVADRIASVVTGAGGRVDSRSESGVSQSGSPVVGLVLRIPSDKLDEVLTDAKKLGAIESMSISLSDVTSQRVDLDARIEALQTSVRRLIELMGRAGSVADLLAAESSLTQRQADLDSLRAQRAALGDQITFATINVNLSAQPVAARHGFLGALSHGWQALLSAVGAVVLAAGFLLPWIPVLAALTVGVIVLVRRWRKARRTAVGAQS